MLQLDLGRLEREWKFPLEAEIAADEPLWVESGIALAEPLQVRAEAQQVGNDVLVRGEYTGAMAMECRRCLKSLQVPVADSFTLLFRPGLDPTAAQEQDVYPLPERGTELDLGEALREQLLLSVPRFALCDEACRGMCPYCGADLNAGECGCKVEEADPRWAALKNLKLDQER